MKHHELITETKKKYSKLVKKLKRVIADFHEKDIHQFRLTIKKLRSFLRLVSTVKRTGSARNLPKKLHSIYSILGTIRSLQLQQQNIEKLLPLEYALLQKPYLSFLSTEIEEQTVAARKKIKKYTHGADKRKIIHHLSSGLNQKSIRKFTIKKLTSLKILTNPSAFSDETMHTIRKVLKDMLYTWTLTTKHRVPFSGVIRSKKQIIGVTKILGEFQNRCVALDFLHVHYNLQQKSSEEIIQWRKLENKWELEKETFRDQIYKLFRKG
jgi:CHAD domain-containing protein